MHECLGSALVAMGPETFLGLLPLNLEAEDPSEVNDWLFAILTKYTIGARFSFFTNSILVMVGMMKEKSQKVLKVSLGWKWNASCLFYMASVTYL